MSYKIKLTTIMNISFSMPNDLSKLINNDFGDRIHLLLLKISYMNKNAQLSVISYPHQNLNPQ